jgi:hypothetical protein
MVLATTSLVSLPPELIFVVSDFLPVDGILALKLTHRKFNETLFLAPRLKNEPISDCAHLAIRTFLSRPSPKPSHIRCILCKAVYPISSFRSSSSPACVPISSGEDEQQIEVVELPQRLCSWHVSRLARVINTQPGGRNEWTSRMDDICMHCGAIQGWTKCDCNCDSCAIQPVRTYTRYLNNERECHKFLFSRNNAGRHLMIRETCWDPSKWL